MQKNAGNKTEAILEGNCGMWESQLRQRQGKVGSQVPENQAAGGAAELGKGERSGTKPAHDDQSKGKPGSSRVS